MPRQQTQPSATIAFPLLRANGKVPKERLPCADLSILDYSMGAVRIIEDQNFSLHENVTRAKTRRMFRIAFDFGRSALMRFHEHAARIAREGQCCGKKKRFTRN